MLVAGSRGAAVISVPSWAARGDTTGPAGPPGAKCRWQRWAQGRSPGADKGTARIRPIPARRGSSALGNRGLIRAGQAQPGVSPAAGMGFTQPRCCGRDGEKGNSFGLHNLSWNHGMVWV